jgi:hypothetical protein
MKLKLSKLFFWASSTISTTMGPLSNSIPGSHYHGKENVEVDDKGWNSRSVQKSS